jgi:hypothetical protein
MDMRKCMRRKELGKGQNIFWQRWGFGEIWLSVLRRMPRFYGERKEDLGKEYWNENQKKWNRE